MPDAEESGNGRHLALVLAYVAVVHSVDTLAHHHVRWIIDWGVFRWQTNWGFDLFEFLVWLVIPLAYSIRHLNWGWFGLARWKRVDWAVLAAAVAVGLGAVLLIPLFPALREQYPSFSGLSAERKWQMASFSLCWTASWLVGWEFIHRYAVLRKVDVRWPRYGWLLVPCIEGLYHLQKPLLEAAGMMLFSLAATQWARRRRNLLLPFLAHAFIEVGLLIFLLVG